MIQGCHLSRRHTGISSSGFFLSIIAACAVLAGCGGGGGKHSAPPDADGDAIADAQDCAPQDSSKWQLLAYQSVDLDGDGHKKAKQAGAETLCSGSSLPTGYFNTAADPNDIDCDDSNNSRWQLLSYSAVDADADGHFIASTGQACSGAALSSGYATVVPSAATVDCDDTKASSWRLVMTYRDTDGDGVGAGVGTVTCVGTAAPAGLSFLGYDPDPAAASASNTELPSWLLVAP